MMKVSKVRGGKRLKSKGVRPDCQRIPCRVARWVMDQLRDVPGRVLAHLIATAILILLAWLFSAHVAAFVG